MAMVRLLIVLAAALLAGICGLTTASAQSYPQRPVRFILNFGPGSGVDITARLLADRLSARWGKPVVVENRAGGDGLIAINTFTSAADDHTLLFAPASVPSPRIPIPTKSCPMTRSATCCRSSTSRSSSWRCRRRRP